MLFIKSHKGSKKYGFYLKKGNNLIKEI